MRCLFGFLCVCALVGAFPQNASAQDAVEGTTSEPNLQEPAPSSEPAPEEPALQLKLDDAGVKVVPTADGFYILEPTGVSAQAGEEHSLSFWHDEALKIALFSSSSEGYPVEFQGMHEILQKMDARVRAAKIGLGVSAGVLAFGGLFFGFAFSGDCLQFCIMGPCPPPPPQCGALTAMGAVLSVGGLAG